MRPKLHLRERFKRLPRAVRLSLGVSLLVLGVLGLFLPILQGLLFLSIGVSALAYDLPFFARWKGRIVARWRRFRRRKYI